MQKRLCKLLGFKPNDFEGADGKWILAQGNTVPTDATFGYAVGCLFIHRDGGAGTALYINEGSETSCSFQAVSALTAAQEALLAATAGTVSASAAVIVDANKHQDVVNVTTLSIGASGSATAVTSTAAELNILDGVTSTATELNLLDGVTATTAELNYVDVTAGTATASKAMVLNASGRMDAGTIVLSDMAAGSGITSATGEVCEHHVSKIGGLFYTQIFVDLTGLNSGGAADDIIGDDGAANCHIGQITAALNGTIIGGRVTCFETPAGGDPDVDIYSATESTGTEDAAISGLAETKLINHGDWAAEQVDHLDAYPAANEYLYLVCGDTTDATYTAGKLLIELWGV